MQSSIAELAEYADRLLGLQVSAASRISPDDLDENLRLNGNVSEIREIKEARLERNGTISVVRRMD
mgnify:FL=1